MIKRIFLYSTSLLIHVGGISQMCDTTIHFNGWRDVLLGDSLRSVESNLIPFNQSELKNVAHATPSDAWYVYKNAPYTCEQLKGVFFTHILVAVGEDRKVSLLNLFKIK